MMDLKKIWYETNYGSVASVKISRFKDKNLMILIT